MKFAVRLSSRFIRHPTSRTETPPRNNWDATIHGLAETAQEMDHQARVTSDMVRRLVGDPAAEGARRLEPADATTKRACHVLLT